MTMKAVLLAIAVASFAGAPHSDVAQTRVRVSVVRNWFGRQQVPRCFPDLTSPNFFYGSNVDKKPVGRPISSNRFVWTFESDRLALLAIPSTSTPPLIFKDGGFPKNTFRGVFDASSHVVILQFLYQDWNETVLLSGIKERPPIVALGKASYLLDAKIGIGSSRRAVESFFHELASAEIDFPPKASSACGLTAERFVSVPLEAPSQSQFTFVYRADAVVAIAVEYVY